jgi:hypothetical protein
MVPGSGSGGTLGPTVATSDKGGKGRRPARGGVSRQPARSRPAAKKPESPRRPVLPREPEPPREIPAPEPPIVLAVPEPGFAARVPPPPAERPRPTARRAIFLDVENTSRPQHLAHVIEHLAVDHRDTRTDLVAVANWKVVSHEAARLLAKLGAQLVHSAPSTGVRDWSDLRLAVAAGIWLAAARPGDVVEIVSDDRAFDAVGDVAASLGIAFHRLSYRRLIKEDVSEIAPPEVPVPAGPAPPASGRRRRRRGGRGRPGVQGTARAEPSGGPGGARRAAPHAEPVERRPRGPAAPAAAAPAPGAHTAPHDEIVAVIQELIDRSADGRIGIDALANTLKARGFRRPPGSPRLMTRLRRIREITVSPSGDITLVPGDGGAGPAPPREAATDGPWPGEPVEAAAEAPEAIADGSGVEDAGPSPGAPPPAGPGRGSRRRRRGRRGRGGRRGGSAGPAPAEGVSIA